MPTLSELRSRLLAHSLFPKTDLLSAVQRLGFVQADPIRSPARCQDLILRHRVADYRAGDLERAYPELGLEEDFTFAYGFLPKAKSDILHPRSEYKPSAFERKVIDAVKAHGPIHSAGLSVHCGNERVRNAWGGVSKATKHALEQAHHHGLLRVACREKGIRIYETAMPRTQALTTKERFKHLLLLAANLFGPSSDRFLLTEISRYNQLVPKRSDRTRLAKELVEAGRLVRDTVDGVSYLSPRAEPTPPPPDSSVRILAPFDPIVRDRERFERFWGWTYRFEAYTPPAKRVRGYYAMPLLWRGDILAWVNALVVEGQLQAEIGFERQPTDRAAFDSALAEELSSLARFLHLAPEAWRIV